MLPRDDCTNNPKKKDPYVDDNGLLITKLPLLYETNEALRLEEKRIIEPLITANALFEDFLFDNYIALLKRVHKYYFRTIFEWAGEFRTVNIEKEEKFFCPRCSLTYEDHDKVYSELAQVMWDLNKINWPGLYKEKRVKVFADMLARIWIIHPFRDGNTRAIIGFAKVFSMMKGFKFDIIPLVNMLSRPVLKDGREGLSIRDCFVGATLPEYPEPEYLYKALKKAMT